MMICYYLIIVLCKNISIVCSVSALIKLLLKVEVMSEDQINSLGEFLAQEKSKAIEYSEETIKQYEDIITKLTS